MVFMLLQDQDFQKPIFLVGNLMPEKAHQFSEESD
jgi:hypothetical protein